MADDFILYDHHGRPLLIGHDEPQPVIKPITSNGEPVTLVRALILRCAVGRRIRLFPARLHRHGRGVAVGSEPRGAVPHGAKYRAGCGEQHEPASEWHGQ